MRNQLHTKQGKDSSPTAEQMTMLTFLREEADANRRSQREESEANRKLLIDALKIVSPVLTVLILFAGFLGFRDVKNVQDSVRQEAAAELKSELAKEKTDIDKRIQTEVEGQFEPANIKQVVEKAAESKAEPLIKATLDSDVKEVIAQQSDRIKDITTQAINLKMVPLESKLNISQLFQRLSEDDADAYDQLVALRDSAAQNDKDFITKVIADAHNAVAIAGDNASGSSEKCNPHSEALKEELASKDSSKRSSAVDNCIVWLKKNPSDRKFSGESLSVWQLEKALVPQLELVAVRDSSFSVRGGAIYALNYIFNQAPNFPEAGLDTLDVKALAAWWNVNQNGYYPLELIARTSSQENNSPVEANLDDYQLLLEVEREQDLVTPQLAHQLKGKVEAMKEGALKRSRIFSTSSYVGVNDCAAANEFFGAFQEESTLRSGVLVHNLHFVEKCDNAPKYYPVIGKYATTSSSLEVRCIATALLNKWMGMSLDPFEPKAVQAWLNSIQ